MHEQPNRFGRALRTSRLAAGLTLSDLAQAVHYSKSQLSKVERGLKSPSPTLARLCDAALEAGGALSELVPVRPHEARTGATALRPSAGTTADSDPSEGVEWLMGEPRNEPGRACPMDRRQVMRAAGAASFIGLGLRSAAEITTGPAASGPSGGPGTAGDQDSSLIGVHRSLFDHLRRLGQATSPEFVLPSLTAHTDSLTELSSRTGGRTGRALLSLASRYAEYAGWMAQEAGDDRAALRWTERAVVMASAAGDEYLAAYALVRRALITFYRDDAARTVGLAQSAQTSRLPARIRGLAAQREAQGHALAGDYDACMRSLDRARTLLTGDAADASAPVIGPSHLTDPVAMITGWCLHDLGRPRQAAEVLDREMSQISPHALRTQARYGIRRALSHAAAGEVDHACALARPLLASLTHVASATITTDVRRLARTLARFPKNASARALAPELI
ncbi:helix-turn-helix transcriptional regulator [Streptomyces sp. NPDC003077]|uniref:helix-turn-helix domain-containing protein n=1 Tax=Streptomyces sp. NPDC003077 TaxID=3154443 RepID=UPI0033AE4737